MLANVHIFIEVIPLYIYNSNNYVTGLAFLESSKAEVFALPQQNITKSSSEVNLEESTSKKPKLGTEVKLNEIIKSIDNLRADVSGKHISPLHWQCSKLYFLL